MTMTNINTVALPPADVLGRFRVAQTMRQNWESLWQECSDYTLPYRSSTYGGLQKNTKIFDGTAGDAIDQLASSLLAQLTPPWSSWIGVAPGPLATPEEAEFLGPILRDVNEILQGHFDRSNFAVEMHQAFLDLVTYGTACLRFDETEPGNLSAFHFHATPLLNLYFLDTARGQLDASFCQLKFSTEELLARFPHATEFLQNSKLGPDTRHAVLYGTIPNPQGGYILSFILEPDQGDPVLLEQMIAPTAPFIAFRWQKSAGELYGRSPLMKALPDIKTANKVVELILKNASIAVTGIWLADDDGILNPANIKLVPGAIIPKAVGSAGLTPLKMPG
ncbi:MAG: Bacteriophage head-to-tail connecting protein, partial [Alphaproteobacteria bacterium]|nr:Bacteriophage head-to-tail connecting protein [Alphaproteobacteria bacterium]